MVPQQKCPIENPHFCLGYRCQVTGLCDFNKRLAEKQERLGPEFEKVLHDNAWELYAR